MASILRIKGRWRAQVRLRGVAQARTFDRKAEAEDWARALEQEVAAGRRPAEDGTPIKTVAQAIAAVEALPGATLHGKTKASLLRRIRTSDLGHVAIKNLDRATIIAWASRLGVGQVSTMHFIATLAGALRQARNIWGVPVNVEALTSARGALVAEGTASNSTPRRRVVLAEEVRQLILHAEAGGDIALADLIRCASTEPLRLGEWLQLRPEVLDEADRSARIVRKATRKSGAEVVPLIAWRGTDCWEVVARRCAAEGGEAWPGNSTAYSMRFSRLCRVAGIAGVRFHDLRAYSLSQLILGGVATELVQVLSGHAKSSGVLVRHYLRPGAGLHAAIAAAERRN